jgi:predicted nucleotidyltransferase component of viral defense system
MIPMTFIEKWRANAKWQTLAMVEQDLIIARALVCLYSDVHIKDALVFRGGTALNKLFLKPPARYSEDIDFVQRRSEPIGKTIDKVRDLLTPWLGTPNWKITERSAKIVYQYQAINNLPAKLKVEINITEHFQVMPLKYEPFSVQSEWFSGASEVVTYELEELIATKLRALYQRRKGRDLFDLWYVFKQNLVNFDRVIEIFKQYCAQEKVHITRKLFQQNMELKRMNKDFQTDMQVLLPHQTEWNFEEAFEIVQRHIINKIN